MSHQPLTASNYKGLSNEKVCFEARLGVGKLQHMMPSAFDEDFKPLPSLFLEPSKEVGLYEIVALCPAALLAVETWRGKKLRVSGTWRSISGPGKGGGGEHTEYYILLDGVEVI